MLKMWEVYAAFAMNCIAAAVEQGLIPEGKWKSVAMTLTLVLGNLGMLFGRQVIKLQKSESVPPRKSYKSKGGK